MLVGCIKAVEALLSNNFANTHRQKTSIDLPGAEFSPRAENVEACLI